MILSETRNFNLHLFGITYFPDWIYNTMLISGSIGIVLIVIFVIYYHKRGGLD